MHARREIERHIRRIRRLERREAFERWLVAAAVVIAMLVMALALALGQQITNSTTVERFEQENK